MFRRIGGLFHRIVAQHRRDLALDPAISPEGRFHHDSQPTLYLSPRPDWAEQAIRVYLRPDDPPRVICEVQVTAADVLDLRDAGQCALWQIDPGLAAIPWLSERAAGRPASSWRLSDLARDRGAQGMIYTARSDPARWHLVLFHWTSPPGRVRLTGKTLPFPLAPGPHPAAKSPEIA